VLCASTSTGLTTRELATELGVASANFPFVAVDSARVSQLAAHLRAGPEFAAYEPARWDDERFWLVDVAPARRAAAPAREELHAVLAELQAGEGPRAAELMAAAIRGLRDELGEALQHAALDVPLA
jgi:DNA-binding GntR family transcriptional regulator